MKKFKTLDAWISVLLITVFIALTIIQRDTTFFIGYFVVGGWQLISMIVHTYNGWFTGNGSTRQVYHFVVAIILGFALVGIVISSLLMVVLYIMIFAAPFMAIFYTCLCYREVYVKMQRPLALLK